LQGTVPFYGSTVAGEARELCASKMGYYLLSASTRDLKGCLPDVLAGHGYYGIAVHGNAGHMFDRTDWYSHIGFKEQWFKEQLRKQGLPLCVGAATGICDSSIAGWIGDRLQKHDARPEFVYWVTLNSHLPVPVPVPIAHVVPCSLLPLPSSQASLCSWAQLVLNVHRSISQLAMSPLARPTVFIVVGDHAPPFGDLSLRRQFSDSVVPYIILRPRSLDLPRLQAQR
jgi:phosphoglycerol transferase MdoB-like AlkP superfamily enzyme